MLKFWAWIYRKTGWFSPWAKAAKYKYLQTQWGGIWKKYYKPKNILNLIAKEDDPGKLREYALVLESLVMTFTRLQ